MIIVSLICLDLLTIFEWTFILEHIELLSIQCGLCLAAGKYSLRLISFYLLLFWQIDLFYVICIVVPFIVIVLFHYSYFSLNENIISKLTAYCEVWRKGLKLIWLNFTFSIFERSTQGIVHLWDWVKLLISKDIFNGGALLKELPLWVALYISIILLLLLVCLLYFWVQV